MSDVLTPFTRRRLVVGMTSTLAAREIEDLLSTGGGATNSFTTIQTDSGTYPTADSATDTLTFAGTGGITVIGDATTDTITFDGSYNLDGGSASAVYLITQTVNGGSA